MPEDNFQQLCLEVTDELAGQRIDSALTTLPEVHSRAFASKLISLSFVTLNGKPVKASLKLEAGQLINIKIPLESSSELEALDIPIDIVFEDKDLLVINKPSGLVVHPSPGHKQDSLVNALIYHKKDLSMGVNEHRPGIVHRLDKDTSGLLVVAKNNKTHMALAEQFKGKSVHRIYYAIVYGKPKKEEQTITSFLKRHPVNRKKYASERLLPGDEPSGKKATSHFEVVKAYNKELSLIRCQLETGRTHQIRIHCSELGHPIVGDELYGNNSRAKNLKSVALRKIITSMGRLGLHAAELGFKHPSSSEELIFTSPIPENLTDLTNEADLAWV